MSNSLKHYRDKQQSLKKNMMDVTKLWMQKITECLLNYNPSQMKWTKEISDSAIVSSVWMECNRCIFLTASFLSPKAKRNVVVMKRWKLLAGRRQLSGRKSKPGHLWNDRPRSAANCENKRVQTPRLHQRKRLIRMAAEPRTHRLSTTTHARLGQHQWKPEINQATAAVSFKA